MKRPTPKAAGTGASYRASYGGIPWIMGPLAAGAIGALASRPGSWAWYATLSKPAWTPPGWVVAPVSTALFGIMGVAGFLVWRERARVPVAAALLLFIAQLAANVLWPYLFFGMREPALAMLDISVLWGLVALTMGAFHRVRPLAGWLLAPYFVWVTYGGSLNLWIWLLNG